jgi:hypothetical protein
MTMNGGNGRRSGVRWMLGTNGWTRLMPVRRHARMLLLLLRRAAIMRLMRRLRGWRWRVLIVIDSLLIAVSKYGGRWGSKCCVNRWGVCCGQSRRICSAASGWTGVKLIDPLGLFLRRPSGYFLIRSR